MIQDWLQIIEFIAIVALSVYAYIASKELDEMSKACDEAYDLLNRKIEIDEIVELLEKNAKLNKNIRGLNKEDEKWLQ
jgi:hypothetical protein